MADWDADGHRLYDNLREVLRLARSSASGRQAPSLETMKSWHARIMDGLDAPDPVYVGRFRGERGEPLLEVNVRVGPHPGVEWRAVWGQVESFLARLTSAVAHLDGLVPSGQSPDPASLEAVLALCSWVHAEWVRIHPFANGNGRTARLWANWIAMRYAVPPFVRLRPRPHGTAYAMAAARAMRGEWRATIPVFQALLDAILSNPD